MSVDDQGINDISFDFIGGLTIGMIIGLVSGLIAGMVCIRLILLNRTEDNAELSNIKSQENLVE